MIFSKTGFISGLKEEAQKCRAGSAERVVYKLTHRKFYLIYIKKGLKE